MGTNVITQLQTLRQNTGHLLAPVAYFIFQFLDEDKTSASGLPPKKWNRREHVVRKKEPAINVEQSTAVLHNLEPDSNQFSDTAVRPSSIKIIIRSGSSGYSEKSSHLQGS